MNQRGCSVGGYVEINEPRQGLGKRDRCLVGNGLLVVVRQGDDDGVFPSVGERINEFAVRAIRRTILRNCLRRVRPIDRPSDPR